MAYKVLVDTLDVIDPAAGEYPDGRPKKVNELHKGDTNDLASLDADRIQVLIDQGAVAEDKGDKEEKPVVLDTTGSGVAGLPTSAEPPKEKPAEEAPAKAAAKTS
jgi:hypothetical protein